VATSFLQTAREDEPIPLRFRVDEMIVDRGTTQLSPIEIHQIFGFVVLKKW
jgi:hypothetical protein